MIDLKDYGYNDFFQALVQAADPEQRLIPARVIEVQRDMCRAVCREGIVNARMKGTLLYESASSQDYPAAGDFVLIRYGGQGESVIHRILGRRSMFSRPNPSSAGKTEQIVAANFDYVFILQSLNQNFNLRRMERYLTAAWQSGGIPIVVLTKADLCEDPRQYLALAENAAVGIELCAVSAVTGEGLEHLSAYLKPAKTIVLLGSSGVGKSSLVNAMAGATVMEVGEVREADSRGRHTTTHRELLKLQSGALVIDTPGMRELGIWDASSGLDSAFAEIEQLALQCRFSDCKHGSEPGCAVKRAIEEGSLPPERFENYLKLRREARFIEHKDSEKKRLQLKELHKGKDTRHQKQFDQE